MWINCAYVVHSHLLPCSLSHSIQIISHGRPHSNPLKFNSQHEVLFLFPSKKQQRSLSETWLYCICIILLISHFYLLIHMAPPALTSNSFLLTTPSHPSLTLHTPSLRLHPKRSAGPLAAFRLGKQPEGSSESQENNESTNSTPFSFNFGKVSDVSSLIPVVSKPSSGLSFGRRKDPATVFVAGATGQAGVRIAQALLREGFSVRAGVPELAAAQDLALLAAKYKV